MTDDRPRPRAVIRLLANARANLATVDQTLLAAQLAIDVREEAEEVGYATQIYEVRNDLIAVRARLRAIQEQYGLLTGVRTRPMKGG